MSFEGKVMMTFQAKASGFILGVFFSLLVARQLGPVGKGMLAAAFLFPSLISFLGSLSTEGGYIYFLGRKACTLRDAFSNGMIVSLLMGLIYVMLFLAFINPLRGLFFNSLEPRYVVIPILITPVLLFLKSGESIFLGMYDLRRYNLCQIINRAADILFLIVLVVILGGGVFGAVLAVVLSSLFTAGCAFSLLSRSAPFRFRLHIPLLKKSIRFGLMQYPGTVAQYLNLRLDQFFLAAMLGPESLGYYSIAVSFAELVSHIPDSIAIVLYPRISLSDREEARKIIPRVCRNGIFLVILGCLGIAVLGRSVIRIAFGERFLPAFRPLLILLPGMVFLAVGKILTRYTSGIGKPIYNSYAALSGLAATVISLSVLVPKYHLAGAAMASVFSYFVYAATITAFYLKETGNGLAETFIIRPSDVEIYRNLLRRIMNRGKTKP
jgi:O-antigen/teichoic acid export membrane protein